MTLPKNEQGQISIFFSASLVVMVTVVAFVINIGLFVKAKINLQNATDAAAFSGAAVQSRQLTKIAYLNWEMRNIYKEWLYKYYVVGNLNIIDVENPDGNGVMSFTLKNDVGVLTGDETVDQFNIPAVCIHITRSQTNICKRYSIPGLPEFNPSNLIGAEQASRAFMDTLIATKVNDCVDRTRLNMSVANAWTYNVLGNGLGDSFAGIGPAILSDRQGAWPRAVELAIRIRNLEHVMNRPAQTESVCNDGQTNSTNCRRSINELIQERKLGNERIVKAFYSGYRNLGNLDDNEMKNSFTLTEIPPKKVLYDNEANASNLLLPAGFREKQWVDLKLMMVNYAIFYAAMIPRADSEQSGACDVSKVAIPVPGYPMGFYKNPDVLTYYAVKGEAEFLGMFNPFGSEPVKMTAYAAAKPFGGRIGPMLFTQRQNDSYIIGRTDGQKLRSLPYITSYDFNGVTIRNKVYNENGQGEKFIPGLPLPTNSKEAPGSFWLEAPDRPLGGKLADAGGVQFGVPNLVYDYQEPFKITGYSSLEDKIHVIRAAQPATEKPVGLFSKHQFSLFKGNALSETVSPTTLAHEISRVRAPTSYEAANYLIPTPTEFNLVNGLDSFGFISNSSTPTSNGYVEYQASIYAPLYKSNDQQDVIFKNANEVTEAIFDFMRAQVTGMTKYRMALNRAAKNIWDQRHNVTTGAQGSIEGYRTAAEGVSDINLDSDDMTQYPKSCKSIAGQFLYFYYGAPVQPSEGPQDLSDCPDADSTLGALLRSYFVQSTLDRTYDPNYYAFTLSWKQSASSDEKLRLMTGYMPGPFTGVGADGDYVSPIVGPTISDKMRRNTYSTKFISLDSLRTGDSRSYDNRQFPIHAESTLNDSGNKNTSQTVFRNPLEPDEVNADISSIKY